MKCPLGKHLLRGPGVFITNPRHIRFTNKVFPEFLPSEKVCAQCKLDIAIAYEYKMKRALASKAKNVSLISSESTNSSSTDNRKGAVAPSTTSSTDDNQPTTSAQAAAKRKRREERHKILQQQNLLAINIKRGARLPHIQPVAKRRQFVYANPDIMDIYLRGLLGG